MREFVYYSNKARTSGNWKDNDLMKAGRMDIVLNVIISAFFLSNKMRDNVRLHLIFDGPPSPPMHLILQGNKMPISKKDIGGLIKRMLYKCNDKKITEVFPGCFIEKKGLSKLLSELTDNNKLILILDNRGKLLRSVDNINAHKTVFVIGDQDGLPRKELKKFKDRVSIGNEVYFASQTFTIIHNELDLRKL